ncbi:MAG TPA: thioredoxin family protein [Elusimicrobiales bacterium]|nr:thioredoxin family protein [Elusimicrobiales bacterium]
MAFLDDNVREELKKIFSELGDNKVKIVFFKENLNPGNSASVEELLKEMSEVWSNISLEVYNRITDEGKSSEYKPARTPAIFIETPKTGKRVIFYGSPVGYEFVSLIEAIKNSVSDKIEIDEDSVNRLKNLDKDVNIKVFVTPTCPYCPSAVVTAHKLAMISDKIISEMIEIQEYPELARIYGVEGVPKIVVNDKIHLVGAQPESEFVNAVFESIK